MREWKNPEIWKLGSEYTEAGYSSTKCDGWVYEGPVVINGQTIPNGTMLMTSGPGVDTTGLKRCTSPEHNHNN